jgi:phosphoribosylaminoimidazole carboxylase
MAAAHTALPVIGVPVKGSALDGVDSLYSIVQMPRGTFTIQILSRTSLVFVFFDADKLLLGVPVATVGINNSVNAALLAARILGAFDPTVQRKVEEYAEKAKTENLEVKGSKIKEIGWKQYFEQM